jgi:hypothetical protein
VVEGFSAATTYVRLISEAIKRQRPPHHISVSSWRTSGDALARSQGMIAALENGSCVIAGHLPMLEAAMVGWQPGAHQPDRVAAAVIAFDVLADAVGQRWSIATPVGVLGARLDGRRPGIDALVAASAARKRAEAAAHDNNAGPDGQPDTRWAQVTAMADYLARRGTTLSRRIDGGGSTPFGPDYDPLAGLRFR